VHLAQLGQTEVQHFYPAVGHHHDVARLEVTMGDAALVRGGHRVAHADADTQQGLERQAAIDHQIPERAALHELHREKRHAVRLFDRVDRHDVRMVESGNRLRFTLESLSALRVRGHHR
jgi:hypothetical protein